MVRLQDARQDLQDSLIVQRANETAIALLAQVEARIIALQLATPTI